MDAAKPHIQSLNPLVTVKTLHDPAVLEGDGLDNLIKDVDLVCVTDWDREGLVRIHLRSFNMLMLKLILAPDTHKRRLPAALEAVLCGRYVRPPGLYFLRPAPA